MKMKAMISLLIAGVLLILTPLGNGKQRPGLELMLYYPLTKPVVEPSRTSPKVKPTANYQRENGLMANMGKPFGLT